MFSSQLLSLLRLFRYRLSQRLILWLFSSLVFIEIIILIPSYWSEERRQLREIENLSSTAVESIVSITKSENLNSSQFVDKLKKIIQDSTVIRGVAVYKIDGTLLQSIGESPQLSLHETNRFHQKIYRKIFSDRYDVAWLSSSIQDNYILVIRHDASKVRAELIKFIFRIALLVLVISAFVTFVMTLVLGITVIEPIVRLRKDLIRAGEALSQDKTGYQFYSLSVQRCDELGDVMTAFKEMFSRVSLEIQERKRAEEVLREEREKSERLLLTILPSSIAQQLKEKHGTIANRFSDVTILFADIVGFTPLSSSLPPERLVELLNQIFSSFDCLTEKYDIEKIKTIGDSYMVAAGLPLPRDDHADAIAEMALDMQTIIQQFPNRWGTQLQIRIGINTGPVVAGVIGTKKFIYDLWGDAVNIASRMESHGIPGSIQVTEETYQLLQNRYQFEERGSIEIKGKGMMRTYILVGKKET